MRPFSFTEKNTISNVLEEIGYRKSMVPENNERYAIINDSIVALTTKYPIPIGLKLNIPFEVVSFYNCFFFQPRLINSKTLEIINFLATNLQYVTNKLTIEHKFPIEQNKQKFIQLLNKFMPEYFSGENDRQWLTRIRVSLMNKYELFKDLETEFFDKLTESLKSIGLMPTWNLPESMSDGIPKLKKDSLLIFSNEEGNEFLLVEKGFITFLRDFEENNIMLRTYFDSYSPLLLEYVFKDVENFSVQNLILSWIRFSRMSLNPLINVLSSEYVLSREFYQVNLSSFFQSHKDFADTVIPVPLIAREKLKKDRLTIPGSKILTNPPSSFNELKAIKFYKSAENLAKNSKYKRANAVLAEALVIFNKYRQKRGVIKVLSLLSTIASDMRKYDKAIGYLNNALD
ncbi:MAG: hypothetical protein GF364_14655, partial [Candidatus Lokiarchaeota archaeon]|nr:hypothetical protein [Candidatus Lokiarchaeota archaeon]